jgi:uncharacterized membrane protein YGL010W
VDNTLARPIDRWFAHYSDDHRNHANQRIHVVCVPLILWSVIALLWSIPSPAAMFNDGVFAGIAMLLAALFYYRQSRTLGLGMAIVFVVFGLATRVLYGVLGTHGLLALAVGVFVLAWIGPFVGHKFEGRKPSFLTDVTYLLIGPAWVLAKLLRRLGIAY